MRKNHDGSTHDVAAALASRVSQCLDNVVVGRRSEEVFGMEPPPPPPPAASRGGGGAGAGAGATGRVENSSRRSVGGTRGKDMSALGGGALFGTPTPNQVKGRKQDDMKRATSRPPAAVSLLPCCCLGLAFCALLLPAVCLVTLRARPLFFVILEEFLKGCC